MQVARTYVRGESWDRSIPLDSGEDEARAGHTRNGLGVVIRPRSVQAKVDSQACMSQPRMEEGKPVLSTTLAPDFAMVTTRY